jgi:hypothetical protein
MFTGCVLIASLAVTGLQRRNFVGNWRDRFGGWRNRNRASANGASPTVDEPADSPTPTSTA